MDAGAEHTTSKHPRRGRIAIEMARCTLGEIMNVSASGLRARYRGARAAIPSRGRMFSMQVQTLDGVVTLPAYVAWVKRTGFRRYDIGVSFGEAEPDALRKIQHMATMGARSRVINGETGGSHLRAG